MTNQKGFVSLVALFVALILIMGLASAVSKPVNDGSYKNEQYENPIIKVDVSPTYQNNQYPMQSIQTACNYMGGSWYQNTNTCAGNIDTKKCSLYGGVVNGCDSSCRYAGSRVCYTTCETTCVFNNSYVTQNQQYQNTTYYPTQIQNPVYGIVNNTYQRVPVTDQASCHARLPGAWWGNDKCILGTNNQQACALAGGIFDPGGPRECPSGITCTMEIYGPGCTINKGY